MNETEGKGNRVLSENLIHELRRLNRADKLRAMQILVTELAVEEDALLMPGATYELLTPYGNEAAAQVLAGFLEASKKADQ
jgi:hypothetical protein